MAFLKRSTEQARDDFYAKVAEMGGTVLGPEWKNSATRYRVRCAAGHVTERTANMLLHQKLKLCSICNPSNQRRSKEDIRGQFNDLLAALGFTALETHWANSISRILVRCPRGHEIEISPHNCSGKRRIVCKSCKKEGITYELDR